MGRNRWGLACGLAAATLTMAVSPANAALPHVVQPGETLWSIAASNNLTTRTVAVFNGMAEDAQVVEGSTIQVPTVDEGAAALSSAGITPGEPAETTTSTSAAPASAPGLAAIPSPWGDLYLDPAAASSWNSMRVEAMNTYGVDLHPGGPVSAYRTYEQQSELYDLFLSGEGSPANPPGTSSHELAIAVDLATPEMRSVLDAIGPAYGWQAPHSNEWWHVEYWG